jgi:hypothetical protein
LHFCSRSADLGFILHVSLSSSPDTRVLVSSAASNLWWIPEKSLVFSSLDFSYYKNGSVDFQALYIWEFILSLKRDPDPIPEASLPHQHPLTYW